MSGPGEPAVPYPDAPQSSWPDPATVSVSRRWLPWRRRVRKVPSDLTPEWDMDVDDLPALVLGLVVVLLAPVLLLVVGVVAEVLLLLALLPLVAAARATFGVPWTVEVVERTSLLGRRVLHTEQVRGWSESRDRIAALGEEYRLGAGPFAAAPRRTGHRPDGAGSA